MPFIVEGLGGRWPEPLGGADVRGLLLQNLAASGPPELVREPPRQVFQYLSRIDIPRQIALRGADTAARYDFRSGALDGAPELREPLIWTWETLARRHAELARGAAADGEARQPTSGALAHNATESQAD